MQRMRVAVRGKGLWTALLLLLLHLQLFSGRATYGISLDDGPTCMSTSSIFNNTHVKSMVDLKRPIAVGGFVIKREGIAIKEDELSIQNPINLITVDGEKLGDMYSLISVDSIDSNGVSYIKIPNVNTIIPSTVFYSMYLECITDKDRSATSLYGTYRGYLDSVRVSNILEAYKISNLPLKALLTDNTSIAIGSAVGLTKDGHVLVYSSRGEKVCVSLYSVSVGDRKTVKNVFHHVSDSVNEMEILNIIYSNLGSKVHSLIRENRYLDNVKINFYPKAGIRIRETEMEVQRSDSGEQAKVERWGCNLNTILNEAYKQLRYHAKEEVYSLTFLSIPLYKDGKKVFELLPPNDQLNFTIGIADIAYEIEKYLETRREAVEKMHEEVEKKMAEAGVGVGDSKVLRRCYTEYIPIGYTKELFRVEDMEMAQSTELSEGGLLMELWSITVIDEKKVSLSTSALRTYGGLTPTEIKNKIRKEEELSKITRKIREEGEEGLKWLEYLKDVTEEEKRELLGCDEEDQMILKLEEMEGVDRSRRAEKEGRERVLGRIKAEIAVAKMMVEGKVFEGYEEVRREVEEIIGGMEGVVEDKEMTLKRMTDSLIDFKYNVQRREGKVLRMAKEKEEKERQEKEREEKEKEEIEESEAEKEKEKEKEEAVKEEETGEVREKEGEKEGEGKKEVVVIETGKEDL